MKYIYQHSQWPNFTWDYAVIVPQLTEVRHMQGRILGKMEALGFQLKEEAILRNLTVDVVKTAQIEGVKFDMDEVRSSIARKLGMQVVKEVKPSKSVDDFVQMQLDATKNYHQKITKKRLVGWHSLLFPGGMSGMYKIRLGDYRKEMDGPMQVVSGAMGKERVHFEAISSKNVPKEMTAFINWINRNESLDKVLKAALAQLWFLTIHPFDDGNGRIARAITEYLLAQADNTHQRFYSLSDAIEQNKKGYYEILEATQKGNLNVTDYLTWFLKTLLQALENTTHNLGKVLAKANFYDQHSATVFNARQKFMLNKLLDDFFGVLTTQKWAKMNKCSPDTALRDITDLINKGVLTKSESAGRSRVYEVVM